MKINSLILNLSLIALICSCSDKENALSPNGIGSSSSASSSSSESPLEPQFGDQVVGAQFVQSTSNLPDCSKETEGQLYFIVSKEIFQICSLNGYSNIDLTGPRGPDGKDGLQGQNGSSCDVTDNEDSTYTVTCENGNSITLKDGDQGLPGGPGLDGGSCSITDNLDGSFLLSCEGTGSVTLYDGTDGVKGEKGETGKEGYSIVWLGSYSEAPLLPNINEAFYWEGNGVSCIWSGSSWNIFSRDIGVNTQCPAPSPLETFTDFRDNQVYKMTTIGTQTWMAENLNYELPSGSFCYDDLQSNCDIYGRLYSWSVAMSGYTGQGEQALEGKKGICPTGWHIPSHKEWTTLKSFVSAQNNYSSSAHFLKAESDLWQINTGFDKYRFSALPSGTVSSGDYTNLTKSTSYLSTLDLGDGFISLASITYLRGSFSGGTGKYKAIPVSLRCIKD
jgi:uncharacterized protein (TIGR02145 family)